MRFVQRASNIVSCYFDLKTFRPISSDGMVDFCFTQAIKPLQVPEELRTLASMVARLRPSSVVEIGTCGGGTLWLWCQLATADATLVSIDLPYGQFGGGYHWIRGALYRSFPQHRQSLHLLRRSSHDDATRVMVERQLPGKRAQFLFIDGDHSYDGVKQDFEMYRTLVEPGGLIAFHDILSHVGYDDCDVARFWREIKDSYHHTEIVADPAQGWAGIGVLHL